MSGDIHGRNLNVNGAPVPVDWNRERERALDKLVDDVAAVMGVSPESARAGVLDALAHDRFPLGRLSIVDDPYERPTPEQLVKARRFWEEIWARMATPAEKRARADKDAALRGLARAMLDYGKPARGR